MQRGRVIIVTLARQPWVTLSCQNFYQRVNAFMAEHEIPIIYAQDFPSPMGLMERPDVSGSY